MANSIFQTRRDFLQGATVVAASTWLSGCTPGFNGGVPSYPSPSANAQPEPTGPITQASLTVSPGTSVSLSAGFAGFSHEKSMMAINYFTPSNINLITLFKLLGSSVMRIGGNSVDQAVWTPNGAGRTAGQVAPSDVDALAAFVQAAGWQVIYGVNLGGSAPGAAYPTTPALAAAEIAYVAQKLGSSLIGIEIGNECDSYGNSYYAGQNWSLSQFETLWGQYRSAILAVTPNVVITGPASASNVTTWTVPFGKYETKSQLSLLTQHYYRGNGSAATSTADLLITADSYLLQVLSALQTASQQIGIPYRIGECNSFYGGGSTAASPTYASALWVIDFLFNCVQGGASGVNLHGGNSANYTPIANAATGAVTAIRPEYYGMLFFTLAGTGTLLQTQLTVGSLNVTAYAVKTSSGTSLVIVNKDSTQNLNLNIQMPQSINSASLIGMTGPSLTATSGVQIQMAEVGTSGSFSPAASYGVAPNGSQMNCYVPALSAVLVSLT